jgi:hypothetical protein
LREPNTRAGFSRLPWSWPGCQVLADLGRETGESSRQLVPRQATFARQGAVSGACSRRAGRKSSYWTYLGFRPVRRVGAPPTPLRQWGSVPGVATGRTGAHPGEQVDRGQRQLQPYGVDLDTPGTEAFEAGALDAGTSTVADLQELRQSAAPVGSVDEEDLGAHALVEVKPEQLGARVDPLATNDDAGAVGLSRLFEVERWSRSRDWQIWATRDLRQARPRAPRLAQICQSLSRSMYGRPRAPLNFEDPLSGRSSRSAQRPPPQRAGSCPAPGPGARSGRQGTDRARTRSVMV